MEEKPLVSIIVPVYNSEEFLKETIESVLNQSYQNFELITIDDCSSDNSFSIIQGFQKNDSRIHYYKLDKNEGTAVARNTGVKKSKGKYISFLDSDDLWSSDKLEIQITYMEDKQIMFTCTDYNKIDYTGKDLGRVVKAREVSDYNDILKNNPGNSTIIYNADSLGKFLIPNIRKRNDYVMWLSVIKKAKKLYGINKVLASHRIRDNSLSSNKFSLIKYHWYVYRDIEKLSLYHSVYLLIYWIVKTLIIRLKH